MEIMQHFENIQYGYLVNKWRLAMRYDIYISLGGKGLRPEILHVTELLVFRRVRNHFFLVKIYLQYVNTHTSVPYSTKIVPGQPISCRTLAVRGGHGATSSGDGTYSSEKMAQKKKTLQHKGTKSKENVKESYL
jgi:hypothetical protein